MMILDTVMDALNSVFPTLTPGTSAGQNAGNGRMPGREASGQGDSSFAATLFQLLSGRPGLQAQPLGEADTDDGGTGGAAPESLEGAFSQLNPQLSAEAVPDGTGSSSLDASEDISEGPESDDSASEARETGEGEMPREDLGRFMAGRSAEHASRTGLQSRAQHGVPLGEGYGSNGMEAESGVGEGETEGWNVRSGNGSDPSSAARIRDLRSSVDEPLTSAATSATSAAPARSPDLPEEEFGHQRSGNASTVDMGTGRGEPGRADHAGVPGSESGEIGRNRAGRTRTEVPASHEKGAPQGWDVATAESVSGSARPNAAEGSDLPASDVAPDGGDAALESRGHAGRMEEGATSSMEARPSPSAAPDPATATSAAASEAASIHAVSRDLDRLEPEFRARLDRVIDRMEREHGHRVELTEGYRSQERQEALYAQGRDRPGSVVTWTRNSLHSQGRAADLRVDGSWENPEGYARLQRIAGEEGLKTLGDLDPGHLELPADGGQEGPSRVRRKPDPWTEVRVARVARVARISRPASVASPARVARVAVPGLAGSAEGSASVHPTEAPIYQASAAETEIAGPAAGAQQQVPWQAAPEVGIRASAPGAPAPEQEPAAQAVAGEADGRLEDAPAEVDSGESGPLRSVSTPAARGEMAAQSMNIAPGPQAPGLPGTAGPAAPGTAARIDEIQAMEEAMNARAPERFHLELDDADGLGTRLRLALRGSQLAGTVDVSDPVAGERMRARIGELHEALTRKGLDARSLAVQGLKGGEAGGQADLGTLLQDPLTGLARILDAREANSQGRPGREGQQRQGDQREAGGFDHSTRQDREREERR